MITQQHMETRLMLLHEAVPHLAQIAIEYVALPDILQEVVSWPVMVNVVPGDEAAGRLPNPTVTSARLLAETAKVKRSAAEALRRGDSDEAAGMLLHQMHTLMDALLPINSEHPEGAAVAERLREEIEQLDKLERGSREMAAEVAGKQF
jgi:Ca-activated chloride channel family protein